ncbi:hypothetical protein Tco_0516226 [Tanacetum coccineum]|uniref:Uncharacterized protein n=1 Tax=Tanacetum coccineum TaxID=301880 RepID=A0ABQ5HZ09_9ASTR
MVRLWWLWWPQPARPPPQRWRQAADALEKHHPVGVAPPQPDTTWCGCGGCGSVVAVGDGLVAWRGCRRLCRGGGGGTRLVEMESVMVGIDEMIALVGLWRDGDDGEVVVFKVVFAVIFVVWTGSMIIEEAGERSETAGGMAEARLCGGCDEVGR